MEIQMNGGHVIHVDAVKNTCSKCANCDWERNSPLGNAICKVTNKSIAIERDHDGSCTRAGLNYRQKDN